jgi:hypothetical protein
MSKLAAPIAAALPKGMLVISDKTIPCWFLRADIVGLRTYDPLLTTFIYHYLPVTDR